MFFLQRRHEIFLCLRQRISFPLRFRNKVFPARQNFPYRADHRGDVFDTVYNVRMFLVIQKNDVGVFTHELDDKNMPAQIPHFIHVLDFQPDTALESRLRYGNDFPVLQIFTQKHAERGRAGRRLFVRVCQIAERKRRVRAKAQAHLTAALFHHRF